MHVENLKFAIVLPIYNEEQCVERSITEIFDALSELPCKTSIIAVNDGSVDCTESIISGLTGKFADLVFLNHEKNKGYGQACFTAIKFARKTDLDYLLFMDCDLTQHPRYIKNFIPKMLEGYSMIKGSRYIDGGKVSGDVPLYRRLISWAGNNTAKILFGIPLKDFTNGFRAIEIDATRDIVLRESGFPVLMEELYNLKFITNKFADVPYTLSVRSEEEGTSTFSYSLPVILRYLKYPLLGFFRVRPAHLRSKKKGEIRI